MSACCAHVWCANRWDDEDKHLFDIEIGNNLFTKSCVFFSFQKGFSALLVYSYLDDCCLNWIDQ